MKMMDNIDKNEKIEDCYTNNPLDILNDGKFINIVYGTAEYYKEKFPLFDDFMYEALEQAHLGKDVLKGSKDLMEKIIEITKTQDEYDTLQVSIRPAVLGEYDFLQKSILPAPLGEYIKMDNVYWDNLKGAITIPKEEDDILLFEV